MYYARVKPGLGAFEQSNSLLNWAPLKISIGFTEFMQSSDQSIIFYDVVIWVGAEMVLDKVSDQASSIIGDVR